MIQKISESVEFIKSKISESPEIAIILGSGLGDFVNKIEHPTYIPYVDIPWFPRSTVKGHAGRLVVGKVEGVSVLAMQGRFHYYEGYPMQDVTFPIRVMATLGIDKLIVTNAAGAINKTYTPGELMLISDHINLMGNNPLIGIEDEMFGPRFVDLSHAYDKEMMEISEKIGLENGILLRKGVYVAVSGPSYETPAEIRMLERIGGDAVGMSTVPEVIVAKQHSLKVLGISCITNMAAGHSIGGLDHKDVISVADLVSNKFSGLIKGIIKEAVSSEGI